MTSDLSREFGELQNEALRRLRAGFPPMPRDQRLVQLIAMPPFHSWTSWALYQDPKPHDHPSDCSQVLVTCVWQRDVDAEKLRDPVTRLRYPRVLSPTLEVSVRQVSEGVVQSTLDDLCNLKVPVHPGRVPVSLDGTSYELTIGAGLAEATFRWHENPASAWAPLHKWALRWAQSLKPA